MQATSLFDTRRGRPNCQRHSRKNQILFSSRASPHLTPIFSTPAQALQPKEIKTSDLCSFELEQSCADEAPRPASRAQGEREGQEGRGGGRDGTPQFAMFCRTLLTSLVWNKSLVHTIYYTIYTVYYILYTIYYYLYTLYYRV